MSSDPISGARDQAGVETTLSLAGEWILVYNRFCAVWLDEYVGANSSRLKRHCLLVVTPQRATLITVKYEFDVSFVLCRCF